MIGAALLILILSLNQSLQKESFGDLDVFNDRDYKNRIFGGMDLGKDENYPIKAPWYVFLQLRGTWRCGATLLNREWVVTAAHCVCNERINFHCVEEDGQIVTKYWLKQIKMFLRPDRRLSLTTLGLEATLYRGAKEVVVHKKFKPADKGEEPDSSYHDIALIKFDKPLFPKNMETHKIIPICLPYMVKNKKNKMKSFMDWTGEGYTVGLGMYREKGCRTNGIGPEIYQQCAMKTMYSYKGGSSETMELENSRCIKKSESPSMENGTPCFYFHQQKAKSHWRNKKDEVVLVPQKKESETWGKVMKAATICTPKGKFGWCGTIPPGSLISKNDVAEPTVNSGWGYCSDDCENGLGVATKLQIAKLDLIKGKHCKRLIKGIKTSKVLDEKTQMCAGSKIKKKQTFFTYSSKRGKMKFTKMGKKARKNAKKKWKPAHMSKPVQGLNWMIGGKDTCINDAGGPLWVTQNDKDYLVGITSSNAGGSNCGGIVNSPGLYTRVKNYVSWIEKQTGVKKIGKCTTKKKPTKECTNGKKKKCKKTCSKKRKCSTRCACTKEKRRRRRRTRTTKRKRKTTRTTRSKRRSKRRKG